ncbi:MAG: hypothetical protein JSW33_14640 [bacterium]|nr:MAG: hypothetical protein JSW33_14640 [bacterium]
MKYVFILLIIFLLMLSGGISQAYSEDFQTFKERVKPRYYYLLAGSVQNFSCYLTTQTYIGFLKERSDTVNTYPLKFIWTREGKIYYVLQPYPGMENSSERAKILEKIQLMKNQFHGFYLDWLNFLISSPLDDIPMTAEMRQRGDSILVSYVVDDQGSPVQVTKTFVQSGRLISVEVITTSEKVLNYPLYNEVEGKWVCSALNTQLYQDSTITSGLYTQLELRKIDQEWYPARADVIVQTMENPNEKFISTLYFKEYEFNLPLQELADPQKPDSTDHQ